MVELRCWIFGEERAPSMKDCTGATGAIAEGGLHFNLSLITKKVYLCSTPHQAVIRPAFAYSCHLNLIARTNANVEP